MKLPKLTASQSMVPCAHVYSHGPEARLPCHHGAAISFGQSGQSGLSGLSGGQIGMMAAAAPTLHAALEDNNIKAVLAQAWNLTTQKKFEHGGWIYHDPRQNRYGIRIKTDKNPSSIILTKPEDLQDLNAYTILADYHCHPGSDVAAGRPSDPDLDGACALSYTRLVFTPDTNHNYNILRAARCAKQAWPTASPNNFPESVIMWKI